MPQHDQDSAKLREESQPSRREHTKRCYANAMIAKIQNERDSEYTSVIEFKIEFQQTNLVADALDYLDWAMDCICEESKEEKA